MFVKLSYASHLGKTIILSGLCRDSFKADSTSNFGVEFATKILNIENKKIRIQIWDTAGQERYKAITNLYYKNAKVCFLYLNNEEM
jgi:small GTP-binding protein